MPNFPDAIAIGVSALQSNLTDAAVGTDDLTYNIIAATAAQIDKAYAELQATQTQSNPSTATGTFLDNIGAAIGVYRILATLATGTVSITLNPGPTVPKTILATTVVQAQGSPGPTFFVTVDTVINPPGTAGNPVTVTGVPVIATAGGAAGNVTAHQVTIINYQLSPGTLTVDNPSGFSNGTDAESDANYRARILAAQEVKYGADDLQEAVISVAGVFDAWINDPTAPPNTDANPSGSTTNTSIYNCYWCDSSGAQPGVGTPNTGLALRVQNALTGVQPTGVTPSFQAFTLENVTAVDINYRVPTGVSSTVIEPTIKSAVVAYLQTLLHNQVPDAFNMGQYVQVATGGALLIFTLNSMTPSPGAASHSTIWRCTGVPGTVVTLHPV